MKIQHHSEGWRDITRFSPSRGVPNCQREMNIEAGPWLQWDGGGGVDTPRENVMFQKQGVFGHEGIFRCRHPNP